MKITVVKRTKKVKSVDVTGRENVTKGVFTIPLGQAFGSSNGSYDEDIHAFDVMKNSEEYDCSIPAW